MGDTTKPKFYLRNGVYHVYYRKSGKRIRKSLGTNDETIAWEKYLALKNGTQEDEETIFPISLGGVNPKVS